VSAVPLPVVVHVRVSNDEYKTDRGLHLVFLPPRYVQKRLEKFPHRLTVQSRDTTEEADAEQLQEALRTSTTRSAAAELTWQNAQKSTSTKAARSDGKRPGSRNPKGRAKSSTSRSVATVEDDVDSVHGTASASVATRPRRQRSGNGKAEVSDEDSDSADDNEDLSEDKQTDLGDGADDSSGVGGDSDEHGDDDDDDDNTGAATAAAASSSKRRGKGPAVIRVEATVDEHLPDDRDQDTKLNVLVRTAGYTLPGQRAQLWGHPDEKRNSNEVKLGKRYSIEQVCADDAATSIRVCYGIVRFYLIYCSSTGLLLPDD